MEARAAAPLPPAVRPQPEDDAGIDDDLAAAFDDDPEAEEGGTLVSPDAAALATVPKSRCIACGEALATRWRFCRSCGAPAPRVRVSAGVHAVARIGVNGRPERPVALREGRTVVGRTTGDLVFPDDPTLSSRHAAFVVAGGTCEVVDLGSTNGTFVSIRGDEPLDPGDVILVGTHRLLYRRGRRGIELVEMRAHGQEGARLRLRSGQSIIGKDPDADLCFPGDEHVSRRHAEIVRTRDGWSVRDLGSTNRTYLIVSKQRRVLDGDRVALGSQLFEYRHLD